MYARVLRPPTVTFMVTASVQDVSGQRVIARRYLSADRNESDLWNLVEKNIFTKSDHVYGIRGTGNPRTVMFIHKCNTIDNCPFMLELSSWTTEFECEIQTAHAFNLRKTCRLPRNERKLHHTIRWDFVCPSTVQSYFSNSLNFLFSSICIYLIYTKSIQRSSPFSLRQLKTEHSNPKKVTLFR